MGPLVSSLKTMGPLEKYTNGRFSRRGNSEPTNHPFVERKMIFSPNLHDYGTHVNLQGCSLKKLIEPKICRIQILGIWFLRLQSRYKIDSNDISTPLVVREMLFLLGRRTGLNIKGGKNLMQGKKKCIKQSRMRRICIGDGRPPTFNRESL